MSDVFSGLRNFFSKLRKKYILWFLLCVFSAVKVTPHSIKHSKGNECKSSEPMAIPAHKLAHGEKLSITYSYQVKFVVSFILYIAYICLYFFNVSGYQVA